MGVRGQYTVQCRWSDTSEGGQRPYGIVPTRKSKQLLKFEAMVASGQAADVAHAARKSRERSLPHVHNAANFDPTEPAAAREKRIAQSIKDAVINRLDRNVKPMHPRHLALELAHYNVVHLGTHAAEVIARVAEYARDPSSEHHAWALKFMAERVLPERLAQESMLAAAGLRDKDGGAKAAPSITINIAPTNGNSVEVIEATPVSTQEDT